MATKGNYIILYTYGKRTRYFLVAFFNYSFLYFKAVFNETVIPVALVGYETIKAKPVLRAFLAIYHAVREVAGSNLGRTNTQGF